MGSYSRDDCIFVLKNINGMLKEQSNEEREKAIQRGVHYSEMLPIEYVPNEEYMDLFYSTLASTASKIAGHVATVCEQIIRQRGEDVILVSLARAGTPIGVLIKRYIKYKFGLNLPHYSISIIRGKGIDENALLYIISRHQSTNLQFIDGWTGKGAIAGALFKACSEFENKYKISLSPDLAVLSDPAKCAPIYGTREDFLVPSACLNSTVSGLISRTVLRDDIIGSYDFHGAKYYTEWAKEDVSNFFVDSIARYFLQAEPDRSIIDGEKEVLNNGIKEVMRIKEEFGIPDINMVKPGVGETTRVLLRRIPWKILVDSKENPYIKHILLLAEDRKVPVEEYKNMSYSCCGLIKTMDQ
ncbi:MAG: cysteine protease StiP family protein [Clostridiaceae bacterium]|nr:cysteine protease StiP family protein [Clostridiaceae bacterium]